MAVVALQDSPLIADLDASHETDESPCLAPGTRVEVRRRFDAKWARGFEVLDHSGGLYHLRRLSDGAPLPVGFVEDDVRPERRNSTWWI
jgi:hypothetical protein